MHVNEYKESRGDRYIAKEKKSRIYPLNVDNLLTLSTLHMSCTSHLSAYFYAHTRTWTYLPLRDLLISFFFFL